MENLRLGVSAVRHDMKREETVEEVEKNTELERQTPKRKAVGSTPAGNANKNPPIHGGFSIINTNKGVERADRRHFFVSVFCRRR